MVRILDKEFRDALRSSLLEAGMNQQEISTLITKQYHQAVEEVAITRLETIINLLKEKDYERIESILGQSPSEDGVESDSTPIYYISFADLIPYCDDLHDVISDLKHNLF